MDLLMQAISINAHELHNRLTWIRQYFIVEQQPNKHYQLLSPENAVSQEDIDELLGRRFTDEEYMQLRQVTIGILQASFLGLKDKDLKEQIGQKLPTANQEDIQRALDRLFTEGLITILDNESLEAANLEHGRWHDRSDHLGWSFDDLEHHETVSTEEKAKQDNNAELRKNAMPTEIEPGLAKLLIIAQRLHRNEKLNRRPIKTLLNWFGAKNRGPAITHRIRAALQSTGLETDPDFTQGDVKDSIAFRLIGGANEVASPSADSKPSQIELTPSLPLPTEEKTAKPVTPPGKSSDDFLEPEQDDEPQQQSPDDDNPVFSQPADWVIRALFEQCQAGTLVLQPEYQRDYVWELKPELPSRLIESILLRIPIPPLYFGSLADGRQEVIDGQQRLTTLIKFLDNKFSLYRLKRLPSLEGKRFRELPTRYQTMIENTPIHTVVIDARGNAELRYEVFERLNRGSMALNEQELRNCVYRGPFNKLLKELEEGDIWRRVKGGEAEPRFKEREMILRFLAFANRGTFYRGALKRFLNDYMENYAPMTNAAIIQQRQLFERTMKNVYTVFGENSGRLYIAPDTDDERSSKDGRWDTQFSIAALEIQGSALLGQDSWLVQQLQEQIKEHYLLMLLTDKDIRNAISTHTSGTQATQSRWMKFKSLIQPLFENVETQPRFFSLEERRNLYYQNQIPVCALCKGKIHSFEDCTVDHITPYSKGGRTELSNAQIAHRFCNAKKNANEWNLDAST